MTAEQIKYEGEDPHKDQDVKSHFIEQRVGERVVEGVCLVFLVNKWLK